MSESQYRVFTPATEELSQGGFLDGVTSRIRKARFIINELNYKGEELEFKNICLALWLEIEGRDEQNNFPQLFSLGGKSMENFVIGGPDGIPAGKDEKEALCFLVYLGRPNPHKDSAYGRLQESFMQAGWPREKFMEAGRADGLEGAIVVWKEVPDDRNFSKDTEKQKKVGTIKLIDYIEKYPWSDGAKPAAEIANTPRTAKGRPAKAAAASAAPATATPAAAKVVDAAAASNAPLLDIAAQILLSILININGNTMLKRDILKEFMGASKNPETYADNGLDLAELGLTIPQFQKAVMPYVNRDEWLKSRDEFKYENLTLSLA